MTADKKDRILFTIKPTELINIIINVLKDVAKIANKNGIYTTF